MARWTAAKRARTRRSRVRYGFPIAAAAVLAMAIVAIWVLENLPGGVFAVVEAADGGLYRAGEANALRAGETVKAGQSLRTNGGAGSVLVLADGSRVEMRSESELSLVRADDGVTIRLNTGGVIVNAAKQHNGSLYVQTKDVNVSVLGTVFFVAAEKEGSRVAVIEGEVRVKQGGTEKKLRPGEQVATNPLIPRLPVSEDISWSRQAETLLALLQQSAPRPP